MSILANIYKNLFALKSHQHSSSAVINNDGTTAQAVHDRLWINFVNHSFSVSESATQAQLDIFNAKHVTAAERETWNAKQDAIPSGTLMTAPNYAASTTIINTQNSGYFGVGTMNGSTAVTSYGETYTPTTNGWLWCYFRRMNEGWTEVFMRVGGENGVEFMIVEVGEQYTNTHSCVWIPVKAGVGLQFCRCDNLEFHCIVRFIPCS